MKSLTFILEDDEIFLLRSQACMMQLMAPDGSEGELMGGFIKKILDGTNDHIDPKYRADIGQLQRAMRRIKDTPFYPLLMSTMTTLQKMLMKEMDEESKNKNSHP